VNGRFLSSSSFRRLSLAGCSSGCVTPWLAAPLRNKFAAGHESICLRLTSRPVRELLLLDIPGKRLLSRVHSQSKPRGGGRVVSIYVLPYICIIRTIFLLHPPFYIFSLYPSNLLLVHYSPPEAQRSSCEPSTTSRGRKVSRWAEIDSTTTQLYPSRPGNPPLLVSAMCVYLYWVPRHYARSY